MAGRGGKDSVLRTFTVGLGGDYDRVRADVSVEGHIERGNGTTGWHAVLVLRDAHGVSLGTRELKRDDASCDAMRAPLALIIVVMIDPDAALAGPHAGYAVEMLELTRVLAELLPREAEVLSLASTIRYAEARRPARLDETGAMVPLAEQDPALWDRPLITAAETFLRRVAALEPSGRVTDQ